MKITTKQLNQPMEFAKSLRPIFGLYSQFEIAFKLINRYIH